MIGGSQSLTSGMPAKGLARPRLPAIDPGVKILATGGSGQVGTELSRRGAAWQTEVHAVTRDELDITQSGAVLAILEQTKPDVVVNAAAYTAVDKAETEPETAFAANRDGPGFLAVGCAKLGVPLIHISTDYVFNGEKTRGYRETDHTSALGVYGQSKEAGERAVRESWGRHIILRTSWVYAGHGGNFVRTMLRVGSERESLRVVSDQTGTPTFAGDIANAILSIATNIAGREQAPWGTYHYTAKGQTTWHGFAEAIFDAAEARLGRHPAIEAITTREYPTPAKRPVNSVLDCAKIDASFKPPRRDWREGLAEVLDELLLAPED
jgi:dTDP-4-dehydrorhamnose reductase